MLSGSQLLVIGKPCASGYMGRHELLPYSSSSHTHGLNSLFPPSLVVDVLGHVDCGMPHVVSRCRSRDALHS